MEFEVLVGISERLRATRSRKGKGDLPALLFWNAVGKKQIGGRC
jgi:hypothetical protein